VNRVRSLGVLTALVVAGCWVASSQPASAQQVDACAATVDGVPVSAYTGWREPLVLTRESTILLAAWTTEPVAEARARLRLPLWSPVIWEEPLPRPGTSWSGTVRVGDLVRLGSGLHQIEVDAPPCTMAFWVRIERGAPLASPLAIGGLTLFAGGLVGLAAALRAGARGRRRRFGGMVAGAAAGGGALLVSHQLGQVPLTPEWVGSWLVVPGAIGGGLQHVVAVAAGPRPRLPGRVDDLGDTSSAPPAPSAPPVTSAPAGASAPPAPGTPPTAADPPRESYARLDAPESVVVFERFRVTVGLSPVPVAGVSGPPLQRPDSSIGPYDLTVQLVADGFRIADEHARRVLRVTADAPHPSFDLELVAEATDTDIAARAIQAIFSVDGQTIGFAVRPVAVVASQEMIGSHPPAEREAATIGVPTRGDAPDLTIRIVRGTGEGRLLWTLESPHVAIALPNQASSSDIGDTPELFARKLLQGVAANEGREGLFQFLRGIGLTIADKIPDVVLQALADAAAHVGDRALTVFLLSEEPYVPWELAVVEPPLRAGSPPFLAAQVELGRWVLGQRRPVLPPPLGLDVRDMVVIGGTYDGPAGSRLVEAEAEVAALADRYRAVSVEAFAEDILACLGGTPPGDVVHFAVHGMYDATGVREGLVLSDGSVLDPMQVKGVQVRGTPFVFLNACQVGSGNELLGDYSGVAQSFLYAGAAAVVAPLWVVDDARARELALAFYEAVLDGTERPAAAMREARAAFDAHGDVRSATHLAYQFYGHPGFRLERTEPA
jgi:hypothetical protein